MSSIQAISVTHKTKGEGIVVDRLSYYDAEKGGFIVQLGVCFDEHPVPAVHYLLPTELEADQVLDFPSDAFELEEDEEGEEGEEIETTNDEGEEHA